MKQDDVGRGSKLFMMPPGIAWGWRVLVGY